MIHCWPHIETSDTMRCPRTTLAWILTGFLVASGVIGLIWAPRNEGKSLEQLDAEREAG